MPQGSREATIFRALNRKPGFQLGSSSSDIPGVRPRRAVRFKKILGDGNGPRVQRDGRLGYSQPRCAENH